jgi:hypothetical protein
MRLRVLDCPAVSASDRLVISVSDDGPGFSGEVLQTAWAGTGGGGERAGATGGVASAFPSSKALARRTRQRVLESRSGGGTP